MAFTIDGLPAHMVHPRADWELPDQRVSAWTYDGKHYSAPPSKLSAVDANAIHYPGSSSATLDTSTNERTKAHLRAVQRYYITARGYSVGYSIAIDERGHVWELRGFDHKCAANSGHNDHTLAVYCIVGSTQEPSPAMIDSIRKVARESARRCGRDISTTWDRGGWWISGHNDLRKYPPLAGKGTITSCCGAALYECLYAHGAPVGDGGALHPRHIAPPPPIEEDDMFTDDDRALLRSVEQKLSDHRETSAKRYQVYTNRYQSIVARLNAIADKVGLTKAKVDEIDATIDGTLDKLGDAFGPDAVDATD